MRYIHKVDVITTLRYLGVIMIAIGIMNLLPIIVDLIYLESNYISYLIGGFISILLGFGLYKGLERRCGPLKLKHAMMVSALGWIWAGISGAIVMALCLRFGLLDGIFENISALTGTGITLFTNVETLPQSILFFRSLEQWVGGLGVVIMVIGLLSRPGTASSKLYQSEARDERLKPSIKNTLDKTLKIYLIYTAFGIILYLIAGMPLFDSVCTTFTSISTGGMGIKNTNIAAYQSDMVSIITMILMILGATSFVVHYKVIRTKGKSLLHDIQFQIIITTIAVVSVAICLLSHIYPMDVLFTVVSAMTTCGATIQTSTQLNAWPQYIMIILMILMIIGGSSGSTVGAIKLPRIILFFKGTYKRVREILSPEGRVLTIKLNGNRVPDKIVADAGNFITLYFMFIIVTWILFCYFGYDPFKSLFDVVSLQGNNGLELGIISLSLHPLLKLAAIFNMWIGRLEIYPVIILVRSVFEIFKR